jgi:hypothetical protein
LPEQLSLSLLSKGFTLNDMRTVQSLRRFFILGERRLIRGWVHPPRIQVSCVGACSGPRCFSVESDTLAVPFKISKKEAARKFDHWISKGGGKSFLRFGEKIGHTKVEPCFLPFYVFDGSLNVEFRGGLGYTTSYTNKDGHRRTKTKWYYKNNIQISSAVALANRKEMYYYAGYDFRRKYVIQAMAGTPLKDAEPMSHRSHPRNLKIFPFETKPSLAFSTVEEERVVKMGEKVANSYLRSRPSDKFESESLFALYRFACPAEDWEQPDSFSVTSLRTTISGAKFHDSGVVYLPVYVVSYTRNHKQFRAFVNGATGSVGGLVHINSSDAALVFSGIGAFFGCGLATVLVRSGGPIMAGWGVMASAFLGAQFGIWLAGYRESQWEKEREQQLREEERNRRWLKDGLWQRKLEFFRHNESRRRRGARRGTEESPRSSQFSRSPPPPPPRNWKHLDDYQILGLAKQPAPSVKEISGAFRTNAHRWHPDHNMQLSEEKRKECSDRFQRIMSAYAKLRRGARRSGG